MCSARNNSSVNGQCQGPLVSIGSRFFLYTFAYYIMRDGALAYGGVGVRSHARPSAKLITFDPARWATSSFLFERAMTVWCLGTFFCGIVRFSFGIEIEFYGGYQPMGIIHDICTYINPLRKYTIKKKMSFTFKEFKIKFTRFTVPIKNK
jgi:hypothetical protein